MSWHLVFSQHFSAPKLRALSVVVTLSLVGCAGGGDGVHGIGGRAEGAEQAKTAALQAQPHPEARLWVDYGTDAYLANIRYIDFMGQSVVAVRQAGAGADLDDRRRVAITPSAEHEPAQNFADPVYETIAVDIAKAMRSIGGICEESGTLSMARNGEGAPKTSYRRDRRAWVVFARCGAPPE